MANEVSSLENTVQCYYFSPNNNETVSWEQLCRNLNERIKFYSEDYIWHYEEFKVYQPIQKLFQSLDCLTSVTRFEENVEDEWFIVYIVLEISKEFPELVIQIKDGDGDFLLIEAADCLPEWVKPSTSDNRVFIHAGEIHLISPDILEIKEQIKIEQAIQFVVDPKKFTIVTDEVKEIIKKRIQNFPNKVKEDFHRALVLLPLDIATVLACKPSLISPLVNTYCSHDMIDTKMCRDIKYDDCVLAQIKFTKCLYAMLHHAKIIKPLKNSSNLSKETILGIKLTRAFYMIINDANSDIFSTRRFSNYLQSLQKIGYFKENLQGSNEYKNLFEKAKEFYMDNECPLNSQVSCEIREILCSTKFSELKTKLREQNEEVVGDNDDWLNISPQQLDDLLTSRYGKPSKFGKDDVVTAETITNELSNFLKQSSDFEGIETFDDLDDHTVDFDPDQFQDAVESLFNILSKKFSDVQIDSVENSDCESILSEDQISNDEIKSQLYGVEDSKNSGNVLQNLVQSMKEEQFSGPSSNILRTIGINKTAVLDSDDDNEEIT